VFDHVTIHVADRAASELFYDTVLPAIGVERTATGEQFTEWGDFSLAAANAEDEITRGLHIGFAAKTTEVVDAFWHAGVEEGFRDDGEPGPRTIYGADYYGGFLLDPDDNSAEAAHHSGVRQGGVIDHLWIRVFEFEEAKAFYDDIAARTGFRLKADEDNLARYTSGDGSFTIVQGVPRTEFAHIAFAGSDSFRGEDPDGNTIEIVSR
jgi:catechol 2,3-dioxygenase-like lactoylglutathione lyase family enzyme